MRLSQHTPALDGIRGTAALLVLVGHLGNHDLFLAPGVGHELPGKPGVWLFFALSAFLLTGRLTEALERAPDSRGALARYALNRLFRIFPLYSLVICAHWLWGDFTPRVAVKHPLAFGPPTLRAWLCFALATLAAWLSHWLIERPGMELGRRLRRGLLARSLAVA